MYASTLLSTIFNTNLGHQIYDSLIILWICVGVIRFFIYCDDLLDTGVLLFIALPVLRIKGLRRFSEIFGELEDKMRCKLMKNISGILH